MLWAGILGRMLLLNNTTVVVLLLVVVVVCERAEVIVVEGRLRDDGAHGSRDVGHGRVAAVVAVVAARLVLLDRHVHGSHRRQIVALLMSMMVLNWTSVTADVRRSSFWGDALAIS